MLTDPGTLIAARRMPPAASFGIEPFLPAVLPAGWALADRALDGAAYRGQGMVVIVSGAFEQDGRRWLHVSFSRAHKLPSYDDQALVKATFIGPDRYAYTVLPPASKHVNKHPYCLHLWSCLDGPVLPDFTRGSDGI